MSAEFELLRVPRLGGSRKLARRAKPLVEDLAPELDAYMVSPETLMAVLGRNSLGFRQEIKHGEGKDDFVFDFLSEPSRFRLAGLIAKIVKRSLSADQRSVITNSVAPHFEKLVGRTTGTFLNGYGLCAGFVAKLESSAFSRWPLDIEDIYLDGEQIEHIGPFMNALGGVAINHQPYLTDFIQGFSVNHYFPGMTAHAQRTEMRLAAAGIGLACLQLDHFNNQCAAEVAFSDLAF